MTSSDEEEERSVAREKAVLDEADEVIIYNITWEISLIILF